MRASRLPLLTQCVGSAVLPNESDDDKSENARRAAEWGKMVHFWKQTGNIIGTGRHPAMLVTAIQRAGVDRETLWPDGQHEIAVAVRVDGTREVRSNESHEYETVPGWITGTADFLGRIYDNELWLDDLKTGREYPNPGPQDARRHDPTLDVGANRFPQDAGSAQLRFYALAVAALAGYRGVVHVSVTHWPYLPVDRRHVAPARLWVSYTWEEVEKFWGELELLEASRAFLAASATSDTWDETVDLLTVAGEQCKFCPSRVFCAKSIHKELT